MICHTGDIEKAFFLRHSGVSFWSLAYVFGRYAMFYYRAFCSLGRYSVVETTIKKEQAQVPCGAWGSTHKKKLQKSV